ncbi:D-methionine transport system permease protein MetI [invertebrate metagenome]|uniref:D-methionine transport system permease protein MetI n=1 Tax=invertebrate metagenome TaxID=1711999 RepID=A0A2H9T9B2_9ZZZZ
MSIDAWLLLFHATGETVYMVLVSGFFSCLIGIPVGMGLYVTGPGRIQENTVLYQIVGAIVNAGRSVPFIILMVAVIPLTRLLTGTSIGTTAAIVPLTLSAIPFLARLIESVLDKVPKGVIESALSMGASARQVIIYVLWPEALYGIIQSVTVMLVMLVGYSAMAGAVGGGGLGDLGIRYGYQRFDGVMMLATVIVLIALVQVLQSVGNGIALFFNKR